MAQGDMDDAQWRVSVEIQQSMLPIEYSYMQNDWKGGEGAGESLVALLEGVSILVYMFRVKKGWRERGLVLLSFAFSLIFRFTCSFFVFLLQTSL
jgi:hypothetical protein